MTEIAVKETKVMVSEVRELGQGGELAKQYYFVRFYIHITLVKIKIELKNALKII